MNFHILAKKNLGPGVAYNKFTTVRAIRLRQLILEIGGGGDDKLNLYSP